MNPTLRVLALAATIAMPSFAQHGHGQHHGHGTTHLETTALLTVDQVGRYVNARGY